MNKPNWIDEHLLKIEAIRLINNKWRQYSNQFEFRTNSIQYSIDDAGQEKVDIYYARIHQKYGVDHTAITITYLQLEAIFKENIRDNKIEQIIWD